MLTLQLLGPPQIFKNGQELRLARRKNRALLYYLAASDRPLTREHLLSFFWPDSERAAAQQVLRTTLHGLRKELGEALRIEDDQLSLAAQVKVDQREFFRLLSDPAPDQPALARAVALYRGDFLADFSLPDSLSFENWLSTEREHLRRMAVRALIKLSKIAEEMGDYQKALDSLERALSFDPLQEDLQRETIRLFYLSGDRPTAIQRYDQLRRLLDQELGVPPMLETRKLYDAILNDSLVPPPPAASIRAAAPAKASFPAASREPFPGSRQRQPQGGPGGHPELPFTGRRAELDKLNELLAHLPPQAAGRMILIQGEPGIGKSRLAHEFIRQSNLLPVAGSAQELEQRIPYLPVIDALRSLLRHPDWPRMEKNLQLQPVWREEAVRLLPELSPAPPANPPPPVDESRLWEGIHQYLAAASRLRPLIFFIDNLHWADASTLALLGYLVRQVSEPVFFLGAARPPLPRSPLAVLESALTRTNRWISIPLSRLSEDEIKGLTETINQDFSYPLAHWLVQNSEGNPFVLSELVRHGRESGIISAAGAVNLSALSAEPVVPQTVYSLTSSRLDQLSETARRIVDTAVAVGREFALEVVYRAAGLSESAALDAVDELVLGELVERVETHSPNAEEMLYYTFTHGIILEVASRELGEARLRLLHRRVAEALEKVHYLRPEKPFPLIAHHYIEGADFERAAPFAYQAGLQAASLAGWAEAIDFYDKALRGEADPSRRREILTAAARARVNYGEAARASENYRLAAELAEPESLDQAEILLDLAESLLIQARFSEVIAIAQQLYQHQEQQIAMRSLFLWGTALSLEGADLSGAADLLNRAALLCRTCAGSLPMANIKFELGSILAQLGEIEGAVSLYREAKEEAEKAGEPGLSRLILAYNNLAYHVNLLGDPDAQRYAEQGLTLAQEKGYLSPQPYLYSTLGEIYLARGELERAEEYFSQGLVLAERFNVPERAAGLKANLGLVAKARGQLDLAIHRFSAALAHADDLRTLHLAVQIRIWLAPLLPPSEGRAFLAEARSIAESTRRLRLLEEVERLEAQFS
jgi:DNA-binding SARP family transcriptional activator